MSENLTLHFFLLAFSLYCEPLYSRSQVHSKRFHTVCHSHSYFFAALTQLILQYATRTNHLTLSFLSILNNRQFLDLFFSTSSFSFLITFCHCGNFLILHQQECRNVINEDPQLHPRVTFLLLHSAHPATQYVGASNSHFDPGKMAVDGPQPVPPHIPSKLHSPLVLEIPTTVLARFSLGR